MGTVSNEFHADLDALKADILSFAETAEADAEALFHTFVQAMPGQLGAAVKAAAAQVFASGFTDGLGGLFKAIFEAAIAALESAGTVIGELEFQQVQSLASAQVVAASTGTAQATQPVVSATAADGGTTTNEPVVQASSTISGAATD